MLRKEHRAVLVSLGGFAATVITGALMAFGDSRRFWLHEMLASSKVNFGPRFTGDVSTYAGNQSLRSLLTKLGLPGQWLTVVFGLLALAALGVAVLGMLHSLRQRDLPLAVTVNATLGLLISPISWSHHWVWAAPGLLLLLGAGFVRRNWPLLAASALAAGVFLIAPHWKMPQGNGQELRWDFFQQLLGNAYVYCGLSLLLYAGSLWWSARRRSRVTSSTPAVKTQVTATVA